MPLTDTRLRQVENALGGRDDESGRLVTISPNGWPDEERHLYEVLSIRRDHEGRHDLIERVTGVRPGSKPGVICVMVMPAPRAIENADHATRVAWCETHQRQA